MQHARQSLTSLKWRGIFFLESASHSPNAAQHLVHPIHIQSAMLVSIQLDIPHSLQGPHSRIATQPLGSQTVPGLVSQESGILHFLLRTIPWTIF